MGLVNALQDGRLALHHLLPYQIAPLHHLSQHQQAVGALHPLQVLPKALHEGGLVPAGVEGVQQPSDLFLLTHEAVVEEVLAGEAAEAGIDKLVYEVAAFFLFFLHFNFEDVFALLDVVEFLLLGAAEIDDLAGEVLVVDVLVAVEAEEGEVAGADELFEGDAFVAELDGVFVEEEDDELLFDLEGELFDLGVVDFVDLVEVVVVVDGVEGVHQFLDVAVEEVQLEGSQHVQVRPTVQVKRYLQLLLVYYPLLVQVVQQPIEHLQLRHLQVQLLLRYRPLPNVVVPALHLPQVLPSYTHPYLTVFDGNRSPFLPPSRRGKKHSIMNASCLFISAKMPARSASS